MKLYHRTDAAEPILAHGFRDSTGRYMTAENHSGVWLSDRPLAGNEGAWGRYMLEVEVPEDVVAEFEWVEEGKPYREFLVPAEVVNRFGPAVAIDEDESWSPRRFHFPLEP